VTIQDFHIKPFDQPKMESQVPQEDTYESVRLLEGEAVEQFRPTEHSRQHSQMQPAVQNSSDDIQRPFEEGSANEKIINLSEENSRLSTGNDILLEENGRLSKAISSLRITMKETKDKKIMRLKDKVVAAKKEFEAKEARRERDLAKTAEIEELRIRQRIHVYTGRILHRSSMSIIWPDVLTNDDGEDDRPVLAIHATPNLPPKLRIELASMHLSYLQRQFNLLERKIKGSQLEIERSELKILKAEVQALRKSKEDERRARADALKSLDVDLEASMKTLDARKTAREAEWAELKKGKKGTGE